jgi:hypothetical protein
VHTAAGHAPTISSSSTAISTTASMSTPGTMASACDGAQPSNRQPLAQSGWAMRLTRLMISSSETSWPASHDFLQLQAQRVPDRGTQHVTGGDLWNAELFGDELCLSTFTGPGSSQQNYAHLCSSNFFIEISWIRQPGQVRKNR